MPELLPRTANGRATRRRILDSATELIAERGVAAVALDDIRERSRTSKSQLYLYFPGRRELLQAVARNTACLVLGAQDGHVQGGFGSVARFEAWCDDIVAGQTALDGRGGCPLGGLVAQLAEHDDEARAVLAQAFDAWERPLAAGFRTMLERDELRPSVDPDELATAVMASLQGGLLLTQVRRDPRQIRIALDGALAQIAAARKSTAPA
ncbi:TetR family transcriptional regulator [Patulibacter sp. NPDC049589]|uniref:TetR/AcrR family transcriptional regulator n=1 Tax=Patulibacter sp. NPDC049589 TaxID=3154731 RepID=UPI0034181F3C